MLDKTHPLADVGWVEWSATHRFPDQSDEHPSQPGLAIMTNYRRNRLPGGTYFFTLTIAKRHLDTLVQHIQCLKAALRDEHRRAPFINLGLVVLPDHLHAIWRLPQEDSDYSNRWRRIKAGFSRSLLATGPVSTSQAMKGERGIWQRRFGNILCGMKMICSITSTISISTL